MNKFIEKERKVNGVYYNIDKVKLLEYLQTNELFDEYI